MTTSSAMCVGGAFALRSPMYIWMSFQFSSASFLFILSFVRIIGFLISSCESERKGHVIDYLPKTKQWWCRWGVFCRRQLGRGPKAVRMLSAARRTTNQCLRFLCHWPRRFWSKSIRSNKKNICCIELRVILATDATMCDVSCV